MSQSFHTLQREQASRRSAAENTSQNGIQLKAVTSPLQKKSSDAPVQAQEDELLQGRFVTQLETGMEEEEPKQFVLQKATSPEEEQPVMGKFVAQRKDNNTGMPDQLKSGVEQLSGHSMSDVKVHYNSSQPAQLNALAYAQGTDIHVAPGQEQHLAHEAWHVAQQKQGRVQATTQMKTGTPVNDDPGLEREADVMGARAMQVGAQSMQSIAE
ncbi:DUF4157 domain-containing protein [Chitinophaga sp. S165]|uniref:eCIS core domain-containing protein n=1 Tax=Chitinophaga sp. S165 TaxID=2135462 RepID=UPI000D70D1A9|nr:DUF4157 domain-containing protein [Chitinophaga sp. S165]PWV56903.1 uncharacterized protein DUF4157 [Chitinophaga sp. S165]